jgi:hypothetical protein
MKLQTSTTNVNCHARVLLRVWVVVGLLVALIWPMGTSVDDTHLAQAQTRPAQFLPPECTTRTQLDDTPINRAWVIVMNFRVRNTGCVLVYDKTPENKFLTWQSLTNQCRVEGDVRFAYGFAFFRGGYIWCYVNIMRSVNAITNAIPMTETAAIDGFYMLGRGVFSPTIELTPTDQSRVVVSYVPTNTDYSRVALRLELSQTNPSLAQVEAFFNTSFHTDPDCFVPVNGDDQVWAYTRNNGLLKFWNGVNELCAQPRPRARVQLWQDGAILYIGGLPTGDRFYGMLDEVIIDPYDGNRPPNIQEDATDGSVVFVPLVTR